jgi:hypothetical protein
MHANGNRDERRNNSINQVVIEWMALNTGPQFQHIPYKGGAPEAAAVAGGDIPLGVIASSSATPHLKSGRVRVVAVTGAQPSKFNPEWPILQSQGVKDVDASNWTLLLAPKGTPQPIIDKINAEVVKERFAAGGVDASRTRCQDQEGYRKHPGDRGKGQDQGGLRCHALTNLVPGARTGSSSRWYENSLPQGLLVRVVFHRGGVRLHWPVATLWHG